MPPSPFPYRDPLAPAQVQGRDELLDDLVARIAEQRVTALVGPTGYGKTSILGQLRVALGGSQVITVALSGVAGAADLTGRLITSIRATPPIAECVSSLSDQTGPDLNAIGSALQQDSLTNDVARMLFHEAVHCLVAVSQRTPVVMMFDDFESIGTVRGATAILRTELQHHYGDIGLLFAGCASRSMYEHFMSIDEPFYQQADMLTVPPLDRAGVGTIIDAGFASTDRRPDDVAERIFGLTHGHPRRTMRVAREVWCHTPRGGSASAVWDTARGTLHDAEDTALATTYNAFTPAQRQVLRQHAFESGNETAALAESDVAEVRRRLLDEGSLHRDRDGAVVPSDPLLADWMRRNPSR